MSSHFFFHRKDTKDTWTFVGWLVSVADHFSQIHIEFPKNVGWVLNPKVVSPFGAVRRRPQVMTRAAVSTRFTIETGAQSAFSIVKVKKPMRGFGLKCEKQ